MKRAIRIITAAVAAVTAAVLMGGCSQADLQKMQQGIKDGINDSLASAANADPVTIEEMQGSVDGQTYTNTAAGFSVTFPEEYTVLGYEDIQDEFQEDIDNIKAKITDPKAAEVEISQGIPRCIAIKNEAAPDGNSTAFTVTVADMQDPLSQDIVTFTTMATGVAGMLDKSNTYKKPSATKIGGMDAAYYEVEMQQDDGILLEKMNCIYPRNYFVTVTFASRADKDLPDMDKVLGAIKVD